jgi:hypothetical protein
VLPSSFPAISCFHWDGPTPCGSLLDQWKVWGETRKPESCPKMESCFVRPELPGWTCAGKRHSGTAAEETLPLGTHRSVCDSSRFTESEQRDHIHSAHRTRKWDRGNFDRWLLSWYTCGYAGSQQEQWRERSTEAPRTQTDTYQLMKGVQVRWSKELPEPHSHWVFKPSWKCPLSSLTLMLLTCFL